MTDTRFDPNVFLSMPREIQISSAAAKLFDVMAIEENCLPQTLVIATWAARISLLRTDYADQLAGWHQTDGGALSLVFEDGLATIDMITPTFDRLSVICTDAECEENLMDIEDLFNQSGAKIRRL